MIINTNLNIACALDIPGWMSEEELLWLAEAGSKSQLAVEIGTYQGRSARAIADNMFPESSLVCVDPFQDSKGTATDNWDEIKASCFQNLSDLKNVSIWQTTSDEAVERWKRLKYECPDFVFIDGDHSYQSVKQDIENWLPKLQSGGVLAGHDYNIWPGVNKAVDECFGREGRFNSEVGSALGFCGSIWFVRK